MAEEKVKWPSNSKTVKPEQEQKVEDAQVKGPSLKGGVKVPKKGFASKLTDAVVKGNLSDVCSTVVWDIVVPTLKDMISKSFTNGLDMLLFDNDNIGRRRERDRERTFVTDYSGMSDRRVRRLEVQHRDRVANVYDIERVIFDYREDAESVLMRLKDDIEEYGQVSVKHFAAYARLKDVPFDYPMNGLGWVDLRDAYIERCRSGYALVLPRPIDIR